MGERGLNFNIFRNLRYGTSLRVTSYHYPILLKLDNPVPRIGPKPFSFEPMLIKDPTYDDTVSVAWERDSGNVHLRLDYVKTFSNELEHLILW